MGVISKMESVIENKKILRGERMMGFFDTLKNPGRSAYDALQKNAAEIQELKDRLDHYSDDQLFQGLRNGSYQRKATCALLLLQERGYSKEEVSAAIKGRK